MMVYGTDRETCLKGHSLKGINARTNPVGLKECRACERAANKEVAMTTETGITPKAEFSHSPGKTVAIPAKHPEDTPKLGEIKTLAQKQAEYMFDEDGNPKKYAINMFGPKKGEPDLFYGQQKYLVPDDESFDLAEEKKAKDYTKRECFRSFVHNPHIYWSFILKHGTECDGTGKPPPTSYSTGYVSKKQTKYNTEEWGTVNEDGSPKPMSIERAKKIALDMHKDDKDKIGKAYAGHLLAVYEGVKVLGGDKDEQIAALFHDAEEDLHTSFTHLKEIGLNENTIDIIKAVSKNFGEEQNHYLSRIIAQGPGAIRVKVADLLHNTRHDRMEELSKKAGGEATVTRLKKKYRPALAALLLELGLIATEEDQAKLATKPVGTSTGTSYSTTTGKTSTSVGTSKTKAKVTDPILVTTKCLMKGDWIVGMSAPILGKAKDCPAPKDHVAYALANGQIVDLDARLWIKHRVQPYNEWATDARITFEGVASDDYMEFINVCDDYKDD